MFGWLDELAQGGGARDFGCRCALGSEGQVDGWMSWHWEEGGALLNRMNGWMDG